ncbi:MAG: serine/threonine-protein kinase [Chloroflexi bacterium]|nr:serine/threonine-protein kinase [Chloroflexota bacterium]
MTTDELIGKTIGGYEILDVIGRGGMATVYRAQQVSMKRLVAVKVLPKQYIHDDTYLQRFHQEVKIVSQLEHRNIVPVYDYGESEGQPYIVMRYMTAGSVDDRISGGPMEIETIISILEQIAPALDYAHSKNVLHRDLKPSNVLMDDDGGAYLTDFGIARILGEQSAGITTQGVVGTPSYMSPEQAQGLPLDNRSDLYALGVMLFEMATGRRPFESDTPYSIAVMQVTMPPPQPRAYNPTLSFAVEEVILKALKKKREERYPHAVGLAESLKRAVDKPITSIHDTQPVTVRPQPRPISPRPISIEQPAQSPPPMVAIPQIAYSPPNQSVASGGSAAVYWRRRKPRRSNRWMNAAVGGLIGCGVLVVLAITALLIISIITGGWPSPPTPTATLPPWLNNVSRADQAIPTLDPTSRAARDARLPAATETPPPTVTPDYTPTLIPVGVRTTMSLNPDARAIGGSLVYFAERDDTTRLFHLDLNAGQQTQLTFGAGADAFPAVSPDGRHIVFQSDRDGDFDIYVMDLSGDNLRQITRNTVDDRLPAWSPDGEWIIFSTDARGDGLFDLYRARPDGSGLQAVFSDAARSSGARWSPDGQTLVFTSGAQNNAATWEIAQFDLSGGSVAQLTDNAVKDWSPSYSPDGRYILFLTDDGARGNSAIARMAADGSEREILYDGPGYEWGASYSPDGQLIAFTTQDGGREEIFVMDADGSNLRQITSGGGQFPSWVAAS